MGAFKLRQRGSIVAQQRLEKLRRAASSLAVQLFSAIPRTYTVGSQRVCVAEPPALSHGVRLNFLKRLLRKAHLDSLASRRSRAGSDPSELCSARGGSRAARDSNVRTVIATGTDHRWPMRLRRPRVKTLRIRLYKGTQARAVWTVFVALTFMGVATEAYGQLSASQPTAPVNIPLALGLNPDNPKLEIFVGINGGAPRNYIFDTGSPVFNALYDEAVGELYDVAVVPGVLRPMSLGFASNEVLNLVTHDPLENSLTG